MIIVSTLSCIITPRERFVVGHLILLLTSSSILLISRLAAPVYPLKITRNVAKNFANFPPAPSAELYSKVDTRVFACE